MSEPAKKKRKEASIDSTETINVNVNNKSDLLQQNQLVVTGYIRCFCKEYNITIFQDIQQICHEFYHKNVIVYQSKEHDTTIEQYNTDKIGGTGGNDYKYISKERALLTTLFTAKITLYTDNGRQSIHPQYLSHFGFQNLNQLDKEFAISICGYQFETDNKMNECIIGNPPYGVTNKKIINLISMPGEYCNDVDIYYGGTFDGIRAIRFTTNYERIILIGKTTDENGNEWNKRSVKPPHLQYGIIGFFGKSGWLIDSVSFVFAPQ
eukprot:109204_1